MTNSRLQGKYVAITGASRGLGEAIAFKCAESGANIILIARNGDKLSELKKKIEKDFRVKAFSYILDISNPSMVEVVFQQIFQEVGKVDVLVNNAGFGVFRFAHEAEIEEASQMFAVNVIGLMACTRMVMPYMKEQQFGHIINIASQAGKIATPKSSVYAATKHAVLGYSNSLRMELARDNIFVTTVNPGPIATNFFSIADESGTYLKSVGNYLLKPEDVAERIVSVMLTKTREINLPTWMNMISKVYMIFPTIVEKIGGRAFFKK